jgi:hypothetical protein
MIPRPDKLVVDLAGAATDLVTTAVGLVGRADDLLARTERLLARIEEVVDRAEASVSRVDAVMVDVEAAVVGVAAVSAAAAEQVDLVRKVAVKADRTAAGAQGLVDRGDRMLTDAEPVVRAALPMARTLVDSIQAHEIDAAVQMIDRMPEMLESLDRDVIPMMRRLDQVGPDVHALLETVEDLRTMVENLPGMSFVRRRAAED